MKPKDTILKLIREKGEVTSSEVSEVLSITRQTAAQHLRELLHTNKITKTGSTRNARYLPYKKSGTGIVSLGFTKRLKDLEEHRVFEHVALRLSLRRMLSKKAYDILSYAFTEMLNNAIDHSRAQSARIEIEINNGNISFLIRDKGIGIFKSIRRKFSLKNAYESVEHLLKGKQTTDPKRHSGQGIFFTSKIADRFSIRSEKLHLILDNKIPDIFLVENPRSFKGTEVAFTLKKQSRKSLKNLFDSFSNAEFEFDRSIVTVHLSPKKGSYVSRSEAKRLLFGLEKFTRLEVDFKHVDAIGQGFADEIFRVFQSQHPSIEIKGIHMNSAVSYMVKRVGN